VRNAFSARLGFQIYEDLLSRKCPQDFPERRFSILMLYETHDSRGSRTIFRDIMGRTTHIAVFVYRFEVSDSEPAGR